MQIGLYIVARGDQLPCRVGWCSFEFEQLAGIPSQKSMLLPGICLSSAITLSKHPLFIFLNPKVVKPADIPSRFCWKSKRKVIRTLNDYRCCEPQPLPVNTAFTLLLHGGPEIRSRQPLRLHTAQIGGELL